MKDFHAGTVLKMVTVPGWGFELQVWAKEELALMPVMLGQAALKAPNLKRHTVGEPVPPILHSISILSNLEELELCHWRFPDSCNTLAISNLSGLRSLQVSFSFHQTHMAPY